MSDLILRGLKPVSSNCAYEIITLHVFVFWMSWFIIFKTFFVTFVLLEARLRFELYQSNSIVFLYFFPLILSNFVYVWDLMILPFVSIDSFHLRKTFFLLSHLCSMKYFSHSLTHSFHFIVAFYFCPHLYLFISWWSLILPVNRILPMNTKQTIYMAASQ